VLAFARPAGADHRGWMIRSRPWATAVAGDKRFAGSISGGCLEQALTEEAQIAMKEGTNRTLRYGTGSPYLDVRLPCGGGIDLYVDVNVDRAALQSAIALGRARRSFSLVFDPASARSSLRVEDEQVDAQPGAFVRRFNPKLRISWRGVDGRSWR
jgi:xanthine dehydrogenase accessory factor